MTPVFRPRSSHYPRTYFILKKRSKLYLLFWLEHGKDNSLYIWFDDDPNNSWEVVAVYNQEHFFGEQNITFEHKPFEIYDPHISWHKSGNIHVSGYDNQNRKGKHAMSDRTSEPLYKVIKGVTVPISQIVLPTSNANNSLKNIGMGISNLMSNKTWVSILNHKGFEVSNNAAPLEGFFIIDDEIIPKTHELNIDLSIYWKGNSPDFTKMTSPGFQKRMLFPKSFSINRGLSGITACIRITSIELGKKYKKPVHAVITCFNKDSVDLFQLKKLK